MQKYHLRIQKNHISRIWDTVMDACKVCGVSLQTVTFANDDYVIQERPSDEQLTFRQVISWVAQIGGQWCRCDSYGRLSIAWYDLGSYEADTLPNGKYITIKSYDSLSVNNEDVVITGVKVTEYLEDASADKQATSYQYGTDGYVIEIKDNKLIVEGTGEAIATMIGKRIVTSGEFKVEDEDGNEVFYVNCDTGVVRIKAQSFSLTGTTIEEIANRQINKFVDSVYNADISEINGKIDSKNANYYQNTDPALAWTGTSEEAWRDVDGNAILDAEGNEILITCETEKGLHEGDKWKNTSNNEEYIYKSGNWIKICLPDSIMKQLDGKIDSYFYDYEPTTSNYPASEWKTDEEKESHNGDLFFWKQKGGGLCYTRVTVTLLLRA